MKAQRGMPTARRRDQMLTSLSLALLRLRHRKTSDTAPPPLFIIGSGRSGNTLVRRVLLASGAIYVPPETFVLGDIIEGWQRTALLGWRERVWLFCAHFEKHIHFPTFGLENLNDFAEKARALKTRVLCASPAYLAKCGSPKVPTDFAQHRLIAFKGFSAKGLVSDTGDKAQFDPRAATARLLCDDGQSQKIATMVGAGISINSMWSVHRELANGCLRRVLPDFRLDQQTALWLTYPKSNVLTTKVRVFIDFLLDEIGGALSVILRSTADD